jgi:hypothetical protein
MRCDSATNRPHFLGAMTDRQERTRKSASATEDASSSNDLMIFGYASKLYQDPVLAHKLATGYLMVPWQSLTMDNPLMLDRYCKGSNLDGNC